MKDEEYEKFEDDSEKFIAMLEGQGVLGWVGMAEDGDRMMSFDMEKLKDIHPELHEVIMEDINSSIVDLYDKGLVEVEYDEDGAVMSCWIEAIMSKHAAHIQWRDLKDTTQWLQGWK